MPSAPDLNFVETESTFDYFQATREYLEAHGKSGAFFSDKHGVFRVNSKGAVEGDRTDSIWALAAIAAGSQRRDPGREAPTASPLPKSGPKSA